MNQAFINRYSSFFENVIIPKDPANMPRDHLDSKLFSTDLVPGTSSKSIMKKIHKNTTLLTEKITFNDILFVFWVGERSIYGVFVVMLSQLVIGTKSAGPITLES